jgi:chromosomal replication initiation ATPase DnaA
MQKIAKTFDWGSSSSITETPALQKQSLKELVDLLAAEIKAYTVTNEIEAVALRSKLRPFWQAIDAKINNRVSLFPPSLIIDKVCKIRATTFEEVLQSAGSRKGEFKSTRQLIMYFLAKYTIVPLASIGVMLQGKKRKPFDHTTVIHSRNLLVDDLKTGGGLAYLAIIIDSELMAYESESVNQ